MKFSKKLIGAVLAGTVAFTGLGLVDLPAGPETQKASAASVTGFGYAVNPIKDHFKIGVDDVMYYVSVNNNTYDIITNDVLQKYNATTKTWSTVYGDSWGGSSPKLRLQQGWDMPKTAGTYRIKVTVYKQKDYPELAKNLQGTFYSSTFYAEK